jgi:hypothetical protein
MKLLIKYFLVSVVICLTIFLFVQAIGVNDSFVSESLADEHSSEHDDTNEENSVAIVDGYKAIQLDEEAIAASGLVFEKVESTYFKPESIAYAEVINVSPLVSLKADYQIILAERKVLQSELYNYNKILKRAEALHKAKSLSTRDLEKNRADRDLKASQLSAMNTRLSSFKFKIKSEWGETLSKVIIDEDKQDVFNKLATHKVSLVLLSLPKNKTLEHEQQNVYVNHVNDRGSALSVEYLQQAQHVSNPLYGESYIYLLESRKIRTGMKLFAWIEESGESLSGYFIPEKAVVWYANEPWIYLKHDDELFIRKPLGDARKINNGWLLEDSTLIGSDLVVTRGGQTLLSEEFKWAIPDEEDD